MRTPVSSRGKASPIDKLARRLQSGKKKEAAISGIAGGARGHLLAGLLRRGITRFVCITPSEDDAAALAEELRLFLSAESEGTEDPVIEIPEDPLTPYELPASRQKERSALRLKTLSSLVIGVPWTALVLSAGALSRRCVPRSCFSGGRERVRTGDQLDRDAFLKELTALGFSNVPLVEDPGGFSVRGSIVDVFSPMCASPARIEFFGDEIESIRLFDPESQRAFQKVRELLLSPAKELILTQDRRERGQELLLKLSDKFPISSSELSAAIDDIQRGILPPWLSGIFPGFFENGLESIFDYVRAFSPAFFIDDPLAVDEALEKESAAMASAYEGACSRRELALPPDAHSLSRAEILSEFKKFPLIKSEHLILERSDSGGRICFPTGSWDDGSADALAHALSEVYQLPAGDGLIQNDPQTDSAEIPSGFHEVFSPGGERDGEFSASASEAPQDGPQTGSGASSRGAARTDRILSLWCGRFLAKKSSGFYCAAASPSQSKAEKLRRLLEGRGLSAAIIPGPIPAAGSEAPQAGINFDVHIHLGTLSTGFVDDFSKVAAAADREILGEKASPPAVRRSSRSKRPRSEKAFLQVFQSLKPGDLIVHDDYGIGRYEGLQRMKFGETVGDVMVIQYAGNDRIYLPVSRLRLIQKFNGAKAGETPLDSLGSVSWEKRKKAVKENLLRMAADLLSVEAARRAHPGNAFSFCEEEMTRFEAAFPFDETPDQRTAIDAVLRDMRSPVPMDRLICGDVGFGKTEVAMRAAFQAVIDGKQVAVLVPTTVLAFQHLASFRRRFQGEPVRIDMISGLRSPRENKAVKDSVRSGQTDILIGTHGLLSGDIEFRDLGLLIIDEEHRFGVAHKEKIKRLKKTLDVLTLTATPIPRTLNLSLTGLRQMSLIATPPADRKPIRTFVLKYDPEKIAEAIRRELERGGQVFFLHNRVETLESARDELARLVPEARFAVAHGQMDKGSLEKVMAAFADRKADVLVCSSIIESGLDIPTANTIIVEHAEAFGLSQLYQIRGRVGRGSERAYAYLMIPAAMPLHREARMRLEALQSFTELGAGFHIAARDLEIRGAGNLLGKDQSGQIAAVGFDLYCRLLEQAAAELKGEPVREEIDPEVDLPIPAFFPEDYMPDIALRLSLYKRMSDARDDPELEDIRDELKDRFGPIPPETDNLLSLMKVKVRLRAARLKAIQCSPRGVVLTLTAESGISPQKLIRYVQKHQDTRRLTPQMKLIAKYTVKSPSVSELFEDCHRLLDEMERLTEQN